MPEVNTVELEVNNIRLYYEVCGEGRPLLLLHGYRDYRCSFEQSEQMFISMHERRKDVHHADLRARPVPAGSARGLVPRGRSAGGPLLAPRHGGRRREDGGERPREGAPGPASPRPAHRHRALPVKFASAYRSAASPPFSQ